METPQSAIIFQFYCATCTVTNKSYIGMTSKDYTERWEEHIKYAFKKNSKYHISYALRKYGIESWEVKQIASAKLDSFISAGYIEKLLIAQHDTYNNGYNMTIGGEGGNVYSKHTEEQRKASNEKRLQTLKNRTPEERENTRKKKRAVHLNRTPQEAAVIAEKQRVSMLKISEKQSKNTIELFQNMSEEKYGEFIKKTSEGNRKHFSEMKNDKEKYESYLKKLGDRTAKAICVNGVIYRSLLDASLQSGVSHSQIRTRMKTVKWSCSYFYLQ